MAAKTLTLFTRDGCPLCDEMSERVQSQLAGTGHTVAAVDVDGDPALKAQYGWEVPLLFDETVEICRHELNLPAFQEWLRVHS
ncbi:MAG TPA: glutaredoxin family protein [Thiobacillus sp.]